MTSVKEALQSFTNRFSPQAATGQTITFQFEITDDQPHSFCIHDSDLKVTKGFLTKELLTKELLTKGFHAEPDLTLTLDSKTFAQLVDGKLDGITAFSSGKLLTTGNIVLAGKLKELFPH